MVIAGMEDIQLLAYASAAVASIVGLHTMFLVARMNTAINIRVFYPILFTSSVMAAAHTYVEIRGYPTTDEMAKEFTFVHYQQRSVDDIVVWIVEDHTGDDRLHIIENNEENREKMEGAMEATAEGKVVKGKIKHQPGKILQKSEMVLEVKTIQEMNPKGNTSR